MNKLYPIFLKTHQLRILIVGGGNVAEEKLKFLLKSSPDSNVKVIAREFRYAVIKLIARHSLEFEVKEFNPADIKDFQIIIGATNNEVSNRLIYKSAKEVGKLVNIADCPEWCDFYLGGIVTRGDLKIGISTNGKSPVLAKRFRQFLEDVLPENTGNLINNLHIYRQQLKGDFKEKLSKLNYLTRSMINKK